MMSRPNKLMICFTWVVMIFGCRKPIHNVIAPNDYDSSTLSDVFEAYWTGMNSNYAFWSIDTTNWDKVYEYYKPKFALLNIGNKQDNDLALSYFQKIASGLTDCHYAIYFFKSPLKDSFVSSTKSRKNRLAPALPLRFFYSTISNKYFRTYKWARVDYNDTFLLWTSRRAAFLMTGVIDPGIVYIHFNGFFLSKFIVQKHDTLLTPIWDMFLSNIHNSTLCRSVILDLRNNPGGFVSDLDMICGQFISQPHTFGYTREKMGNGRLEYTPWADAIVSPANNPAEFRNKKIVILTDQRSISMAETSTIALKSIPGLNVTTIGDTTFGATCPLSENFNLFGGGIFRFAHFGYVYTSSVLFKGKDGTIYENKGIPPDVYLPYNYMTDSTADRQLEAAIKMLQ